MPLTPRGAGGVLLTPEATPAAPAAGTLLYTKTGGGLFYRNAGGAEIQVPTSSGGGGANAVLSANATAHKMTVSPNASPPANPVDGDVWVVPDVTTPVIPSIRYVTAQRTAGNVIVNSFNVVVVDTALDLTVNAAVGDLVTYGVNIQALNEAPALDLNVVTMVGGVETTRLGGTGGTGTIGAWTIRGNEYHGTSGTIPYLVRTADLTAGKATFRLLAKADGNRTVLANTAQPLIVWVINFGPTGV